MEKIDESIEDLGLGLFLLLYYITVIVPQNSILDQLFSITGFRTILTRFLTLFSSSSLFFTLSLLRVAFQLNILLLSIFILSMRFSL